MFLWEIYSGNANLKYPCFIVKCQEYWNSLRLIRNLFFSSRAESVICSGVHNSFLFPRCFGEAPLRHPLDGSYWTPVDKPPSPPLLLQALTLKSSTSNCKGDGLPSFLSNGWARLPYSICWTSALLELRTKTANNGCGSSISPEQHWAHVTIEMALKIHNLASYKTASVPACNDSHREYY